jgi:hypothetical protein
MDYDKFEYEMDLEFDDKHRDFILSQNNCTLCGTSLELSHNLNETLNTIQEEAHCPSCHVRTRARTYSLQ